MFNLLVYMSKNKKELELEQFCFKNYYFFFTFNNLIKRYTSRDPDLMHGESFLVQHG